jgi:glyoxylase-like metal-dependent hydrolase (beta-lactamase superfamily II)
MTRTFALGSLLAIGAATVTVAAVQQAPAAPMVVEVDKIQDNLYVLKGGGGNTALFITANGVTVVDTKLPGWGQPLLEKIKSITPKPITTVINTHTHFDHVSGNIDFPATVEFIAQENTKTYMDQANPVYGLQTGQQPNIFKQNNGKGMPKRTFKDKMTLGKGADEIDLYYFGRAHTGGDAYVVFPALRVMHVGDTMATRDLPIMDINNGGSGVEFAKTLTGALGVKNIDTLINGHNPATTTPADLKLYSEFITDFVAFVQSAKKSGKTVDEVVSTWKTPAKYAGYATPNPMRVKADAQVIWDETK